MNMHKKILVLVALFALCSCKDVKDKSPCDDIKQLESLAESDAKAQSNLRAMYDNGQGVKQDYAKAIEYYQKAADQGYAAAQYNLGVMYDDTKG